MEGASLCLYYKMIEYIIRCSSLIYLQDVDSLLKYVESEFTLGQ